jgi:hypothetical protein
LAAGLSRNSERSRIYLRSVLSMRMCCKQGYFRISESCLCPETPINWAFGIKQRVLILFQPLNRAERSSTKWPPMTSSGPYDNADMAEGSNDKS